MSARPPMDTPEEGADPGLTPLPGMPPPLEEDAAPDTSKRASRAKRASSSGSSSSRSSSSPRPRKERAPNTVARAGTRRAALERGVSNTVNSVAFAVSMLDAADGAIIAQGERDLTAAIMNTADQNPRFSQWLERSLKGGSYLQLVAAVGAIALPIAARHGMIPRQLAFAAPAPGSMRAPDAPPADWVPVQPVQGEDGRWYGVAPDGQLVPLDAPPNGTGS